jgi:hypothetical protein
VRWIDFVFLYLLVGTALQTCDVATKHDVRQIVKQECDK